MAEQTEEQRKRQSLEHKLEQTLQELRVVQTGVQILSAFLLTLPFTQRFTSTSGLDKALYLVSLVAAVVTTALVLAPVSYHRRHHHLGDGVEDLPEVIRVAVLLTLLGMTTLMIAAVSSILLAIDMAVGLGWAVPIAVAVTAVFISLWFGLPMRRRGEMKPSRDKSRVQDESDESSTKAGEKGGSAEE
ncbi:MAG: amine oxidase [Catenulispora sp.]|nr:amine oxidase [Catenulispora sp.]